MTKFLSPKPTTGYHHIYTSGNRGRPAGTPTSPKIIGFGQAFDQAVGMFTECANEGYFQNRISNDCGECPVRERCWDFWSSNVCDCMTKLSTEEYIERIEDELRKLRKRKHR